MSVWEKPPTKSIPQSSSYPVISSVSITAFGLVTWTTDVASTSQVAYGTIPMMGPLTTDDTALVTSHSVQLPSISRGTYYYLKTRSVRLGSLSISDLYTFLSSSAYSGIILRSPDGTRWSVVPTVSGNLETTVAASGPSGSYDPTNVVLKDSNTVYWIVTISNAGNLTTTSGGSAADSLNSIPLADSSFVTWNVTVSITGGLTTT